MQEAIIRRPSSCPGFHDSAAAGGVVVVDEHPDDERLVQVGEHDAALVIRGAAAVPEGGVHHPLRLYRRPRRVAGAEDGCLDLGGVLEPI